MDKIENRPLSGPITDAPNNQINVDELHSKALATTYCQEYPTHNLGTAPTMAAAYMLQRTMGRSGKRAQLKYI